MIRAVIVRAARDDHFLPVSLEAGEREKIGAGFAGGVRRARIERRLLGEFSRFAERAVNFVGRNLDEALDAVPSRAIEQHARADDVGVDEVLRRIDAAIDMRLGREIDHRVKLMLGHERVHLVEVGDVGFEKFVALSMFFDHAIEIGGISGVSKGIDIGHGRGLVMLQNVANKIAANESAAARNQYAHRSAY